MFHDKNMHKTLVDLLNQELSCMDQVYIDYVARVIVGQNIDCSMDDLATALLKSNISVGKILAALLRCEWLTIQRLLEQAQPDHMKQQVKQFSDCVEHFNLLQDAVISAADNHWQATINHERKARILAECKADWLEKGSVQVHNYFMEVPVTAKVPFISFDAKHHLHVKASPELGRVFSVGGAAMDALISSPDRKYNLQVGVFQCRGMQLTLSVRAVVEALQESRSEVRVQIADNISAQLVSAGKRVSASIVDLSCTGVGLHIKNGKGIRHGDVVGWLSELGTTKLELKEARVCWVTEEGNDLRLGLKLNPDSLQREAIYKYLFVQQQKIAGRIHQLGKPPWMR